MTFEAVCRQYFVCRKFNQLTRVPGCASMLQIRAHDFISLSFLICLGAFFRSRYSLSLEILVLRQQLGILKQKIPRPRLQLQDRLFWILLRRLWPGWRDALVIVKPETVVAWHRAGFRLFWRLRSRAKSRAGQRSMRRYELSSSEWRTRIPAGALPEFTVSF